MAKAATTEGGSEEVAAADPSITSTEGREPSSPPDSSASGADDAPVSADPFGAFDAPVREANKKPKARAVDEGIPSKPKRGRKKKDEVERSPEELKEKAERSAATIVGTVEVVFLGATRARFSKYLQGAELDALVQRYAFTEEEGDSIVQPLAEILEAEGIDMPPELRLAFAVGAVVVPKLMMGGADEREIRARLGA